MKKTVSLLLALIFCITLVSCSGSENNPSETKVDPSETEPVYEDGRDTNDSMINYHENDKRAFVVDYIRKMAEIEWKPEKSFSLTGKYQAWSYNLSYNSGRVYYGLPFLTNSRGTLSQFEDYIVDGVYTGPTDNNCVGDACYDAVYATLIQVCPSITFKSTEDMLPGNGTGLKAVGDYKVASKHDSPEITLQNSIEVMAKAFAQLQPGDVLAKHVVVQDAGHARIVSKAPEIVYKADGSIDPDKSIVTTIEQTNAWDKTVKNKATTWWVDHTYSFKTLYDTFFAPLTCEDYDKTPEKLYTICKNMLSSEKLLDATKLSGTITSNYLITAIRATVKDESGKTVWNGASYPKAKRVYLTDIKIDKKLNTLAKGKYTYSVDAEFGSFGVKTVDTYQFEIQ